MSGIGRDCYCYCYYAVAVVVVVAVKHIYKVSAAAVNKLQQRPK
jgi:hypothetical protein